jgi:hypothetical protein
MTHNGSSIRELHEIWPGSAAMAESLRDYFTLEQILNEVERDIHARALTGPRQAATLGAWG